MIRLKDRPRPFRRAVQLVRDASPAKKLLIGDLTVVLSVLGLIVYGIFAFMTGTVVGRSSALDQSRLRFGVLGQLAFEYRASTDQILIKHQCNGTTTRLYDPVTKRLIPENGLPSDPSRRIEDYKELVLVLVGAGSAHLFSAKHQQHQPRLESEGEVHVGRVSHAIEEANHGSAYARAGKLIALLVLYGAGDTIGRTSRLDCDAQAVANYLAACRTQGGQWECWLRSVDQAIFAVNAANRTMFRPSPAGAPIGAATGRSA